MLDAGDHDAGLVQRGNVFQRQSVEIGIDDLDVQGGQIEDGRFFRGGERFSFRLRPDAEHHPQQHHRQDDSQKAKRIRQGEGRPGELGGFGGAFGGSVNGFERFFGGTQGGGVGRSAGEQAHGGLHICAREMRDAQGQYRSQGNDGQGHKIQRQTAPPQGGDESRPHLHADGVHEED